MERRWRPLLAGGAFLLVAGGVSAFLHLGLAGIPDRDALYHFRHAALYAENGPFWRDFHWWACSALAQHQADIWYGFHLFLLPFTSAADPVRGVKLAGAGELTFLLLCCYLAARHSKLRPPFLWPFALLVFCPFVLYRLLMTRPHVFSLGLLVLLLSVSVSETLPLIALVCSAVLFAHLGLSWMVPAVLLTVFAVKRLTEGRWAWRALAAGLAGAFAGGLLHPNPVGAAKLASVQLVQLASIKAQGIPLLFGADLRPGLDSFAGSPMDALRMFVPGCALWLGAAVVMLAAVSGTGTVPARRRTLLWSCLLLSAGAFIEMLQSAIRFADLWTVFSVFFIGVVFTDVVHGEGGSRPRWLDPALLRRLAAAIGLLAVFMLWSAGRDYATRMPEATYEPHRLENAAAWLQEYAQPEEIVFPSHWDLFPELFFWNPRNRYVGAMDPVFQYAYAPGLYWKAHHIYTGRAADVTYSGPTAAPHLAEDVYTALVQDFGASHLVLEKKRVPALVRHAASDPRFGVGYEDEHVAIFDLRAGST